MMSSSFILWCFCVAVIVTETPRPHFVKPGLWLGQVNQRNPAWKAPDVTEGLAEL